jgi:hypothetical protein
MTLDGARNGFYARWFPPKCCEANTRLVRREHGCLTTQRRILCHLNTVMQQRRRQHFKVTSLLPMNQLNVAPDTHDMGHIVRSIFIVRGSVEELCRELIERMEHR